MPSEREPDFEVKRWSHGAMSGPPLHVHHDDDEVWHVIEGTLRFRLGDDVVDAGPNDTITAPAGTPHTYGSPGDVTYLIITTPRIFALIEALHESHDDAADVYRRFASEMLE
ncbi:MAG: cupin domain-containing protein [Actinomycetota bacterium]